MIDLDTWQFGAETFSSAEEFCTHISVNGRGYQRRLQARVMADSVYQNWKRSSPTLRQMPFYSAYRKSEESKKFHASVQAVASGAGTDKDCERLAGLTREILQSPVVLKPGQKLFHGRHLDIAATPFPSSYPVHSFLSCTLCPEVAAWHAISKAGQYAHASHAAVFIITLANACPVIFGAKGRLDHEQEILLPPTQTLQLTVARTIPNGTFNIIHAILTYSP